MIGGIRSSVVGEVGIAILRCRREYLLVRVQSSQPPLAIATSSQHAPVAIPLITEVIGGIRIEIVPGEGHLPPGPAIVAHIVSSEVCEPARGPINAEGLIIVVAARFVLVVVQVFCSAIEEQSRYL